MGKSKAVDEGSRLRSHPRGASWVFGRQSFLSRKVGQEDDEATKEQVQLPLGMLSYRLPVPQFPHCPGGSTASARSLGCEDEKCAHSLGSYFKNKPKAP